MQGTAEVVYAKRADAQQAISRYNNVQLDGKPMKIELIGSSAPAQAVSRVGLIPAAGVAPAIAPIMFPAM